MYPAAGSGEASARAFYDPRYISGWSGLDQPRLGLVGLTAPMSELVTQRPPPSKARFELLVYTRHQSQVFPLVHGSIVNMGRGSDNTIHLDDASVSRAHARLHVGEEVFVEDLNSANGTMLMHNSAHKAGEETEAGGNHRILPRELVPMTEGDVVRLGAVIVVLQRKNRINIPAPRVAADRSVSAVVVDPEMIKVYELATRAAGSDISVLILGETGVGKEVLAEALHRRSPRAAQQLLRLNCAALPESLLEGELFGHERGAFTGAHAQKIGLLESTDKGTVFLDEIGELPLGTQAKLLRVLEERVVLRLGSTKPRQIDVRFVTASNRDLGREVRAGRFRSDLYYRISGLVVRIPALRERRAEIEPLARHFLREFCVRSGQLEPLLTAEALARLNAYEWPGNVRELRNVMERAALLANEGKITREQVLLEPADEIGELDPAEDFDAITRVVDRPASLAGSPASPELSPATSERDRIVRALEACGGNQTRAAKLLGFSRRTLINRLEEFSLPRPKKC